MTKDTFDCFNVYIDDENYAFVHIEIEDSEKFYRKMFNYFFSENKLLGYCENKVGIQFTPSKANYTLLYKHLKTYIDDKNEIIDISKLDKAITAILEEEGIVKNEKGEQFARKDKIGKIGEYIFCCLLADYFNFDCIIPKVHLQTDYNMNVYGIDVLFYSSENDTIMFGESKFCISLDNGIKLIKKSLSEYEQQLKTEFELVLSKRFYKDKLNIFKDIYFDKAEECIDFEEFVKEAHINKIGIPIFIAHGTQLEPGEILDKMKDIPKNQFFGVDTIYYCISLPTVDKYKMVAAFTGFIRESEIAYERNRHE